MTRDVVACLSNPLTRALGGEGGADEFDAAANDTCCPLTESRDDCGVGIPGEKLWAISGSIRLVSGPFPSWNG